MMVGKLEDIYKTKYHESVSISKCEIYIDAYDLR